MLSHVRHAARACGLLQEALTGTSARSAGEAKHAVINWCYVCIVQVLIWASGEELTKGHKVFDTVTAVAKDFKGKVIFVTIDNTGSHHEPVTNFFGLKDKPSPQVRTNPALRWLHMEPQSTLQLSPALRLQFSLVAGQPCVA